MRFLVAVEDKRERVAFGGPTTIRVRDRQVYLCRLLFFPDRARNLLAVQQVMLDTGEDAAPVTTVDGFINNSADLYVNSIPTEYSVVDAAKQIEEPALFPHRRIAGRFVSVSPCFGFVLRHGA